MRLDAYTHVDKLGGGVNVAEGNDGDVGVASLGDGLVVGPGIGDDQEAGLAEGGLDLVSEGAGSEAASDGGAADVPGNKTFTTLKQTVVFSKTDNSN